jgi:glycosyltransferase involved in cell wall biosynthesis
MKILFDARVLGKHMHGIARYAQNLLQQLLTEDRGHEFLVLIGHPQIRERFNPDGPVRWIQTATPLYSLQEQFLIPWQIRNETFNLYHSPTYTIPLVFSTKGIITIHDLIHLLFPQDYGLRHRLFYSLLVRRAISRCPKIFTVSEQSKKDIIHLLQGPKSRITVTSNGLDPHWGPHPSDSRFVKQYGLEKGFILFVGNPRPHKNFPRVLSAFEKVTREDSYPGKLVAVGISPQDFSVKNPEQVVFFPLCNDQELGLLYSGADLLASPSLYEGFGLPVLEAMACGCPVVVGNQGALPEITAEAGLQVNPYDVHSIWTGIRQVLADKDLSRRMREQGLQRAAGYTWQKTARYVLESYNSLAKVL